MHVCVLTVTLDIFKGGNHLPLFAALPDVQFTILANRTKPADPELPPNIRVITLDRKRMGPYYYGLSDWRYAQSVLQAYPPSDEFWQQFDAIHLNQTLSSNLLALQTTGKPMLYVIHHPVTVDRKIAVKESPFFEGLEWRLKYARLIREQGKLCQGMPAIMTVSNTAKERIADDYHCDADKIHVVPNGVSGEEYPLADGQEKYDAIAIGAFLHPRKGFRYLLEVYRELAHKDLRIADVGRRSEEQIEALKAIDGVDVYEMVPAEQLVSLLQSSKTLISTALYEGFGLTLIEALATGRPAFAFAAGAVPEVLGGIDESFVIPKRDPGALVKRVEEWLAQSDEERQERGRQLREKVLENYAMEKAANELRNVYERICS